MRRRKTDQKGRTAKSAKIATGRDTIVGKDYEIYHFSAYEILLIGIKYNLLFLIIAKLFYNCIPVFLLGNIGFAYILKREGKKKVKQQKEQLKKAFQEFILSFGHSLKAGYSIENAFISAYQDLQFLYDNEVNFLKECQWIILQMQNNLNLEDLLVDFASRSGCKDIIEFAHVFRIAKKSGGNISQMIQETVQIMNDKITVKEEIQILITSKKMEQVIMDIVPMAIMFYISFTSKGYFDVLYYSPAGILIMSGCLLLYFFSFIFSEKIMEIELDDA